MILHPVPDHLTATVLLWQPAPHRPALAALFALDAQLARVVFRTREPMLGQISLAWWRERLGDPPARWPGGEPVLAALRDSWGENARGLAPLVDGFEALLGGDPPPVDAVQSFATGRGAALCALAELVGAGESAQASAETVGERWAWAQLRVDGAHIFAGQAPLPRSLRGVAVLDGLARRSLANRTPMLSTRGDALAAWRLGMGLR